MIPLDDRVLRHSDRVHKFGQNPDVDTGTLPEDVWDAGGVYPWPVAAFTPTIIVASTDDDGAGIGARTIKILGLDADYKIQSETITLSGTSATAVNSYIRLFRAYVVTVGGSTHGTNAGNIQALNSTTTVLQITAGKGQTLMAVYTIGSTYHGAEFLGGHVSLAGGTLPTSNISVGIDLQARPYGGAWRVQDTASLYSAGSANAQIPFGAPVRLDPMTDIRVRVTDTTGTNLTVSAAFDMLLINK